MTFVTKIEVEAFRNFAERSVLRVADLPPGLHFVRGVNAANERLGSNGAGKSTFFSDAVAWCLYGRTIAGLKTTDVRSWLTDKLPRVAVGIVRDGTEHVVQRGPKATALTIDGKTVGQGEVDALVGCGFAAFAQAVVWGQGQPLFFDLAPADKMALLSDALDLERWERRAEAAGARARRLEAALAALEGELRGLDAAAEQAEAALAEAKDAAQRWGREHAAELTELGEKVRELGAAAERLEKKRAEEDLSVERAAMALRVLEPALEEGRREARELEGGLRATEAAIARLRSALADARTYLTSFADRGTCPTCGQAVGARDAKKHARELSERINDLEQHELAEAEEERAHYSAAVAEADEHRDTHEADAKRLGEELRTHEVALQRLVRDAATASAQLAAASDALTQAEGAVNPHRDAASQARARRAEVRAKVREGEEKAGKYEASVERAKFWARGFRDIRLAIVDDVVAELRDATAEVMDSLGLGDWSVEYATEQETKSGSVRRALSISVRAPGAPEGARWEVYSGGERQRLRIAGALALSEVLLGQAGGGLDFRVFDEPTRGLSAEGVRDLCEALADYAESAGLRIFMIDHAAIEGAAFASTIVVRGSPDGAALEV